MSKHFLLILLMAICGAFTVENASLCMLHTPLSTDAFSEKEYPKGYFQSPVEHTIRLSGTFGELRPNHFHAGIDIKSSKGRVGDVVVAAADGYIARIKVQAGGYGNALYIRHPNGYSTVYAHLHTFTDELNEYVKSKQYSRQSFGVDLYPEAGKFKFKKGEKIGLMGNSGGSYGPHLHFEIRDSGTEKPINPLLFKFDMEDNMPPKMHQIKVYHLNGKLETTDTKVLDLVKKGNKYGIRGDTLTVGAWRAGFGLKVYDHHNNVSNWNGIYSLQMLVDGEPTYDFRMEQLSFSETRYINAHMDYAERKMNKAYFNRCYELPGNKLSIYDKQVEKGVVKLYLKKAQKITMLAKDADGNATTLEFWVKRKEDINAPKGTSFNYTFQHNQENTVNRDDLSLYFPKGSLYENLYLKYETKATDHGFYAPMHRIHNNKTPVHKYFTISIKPSKTIPAELRDKAYVAYVEKDGSLINCGGTWKNGKLQAKVRELGDYSICIDDTQPKISAVDFSSNMKGYNKMSFKMKDMETGGKARGLKYKATVDGKWILMEHDGKKDMLTHRFDGRIGPGEHQLKLVVTDNRGNKSVFERRFSR